MGAIIDNYAMFVFVVFNQYPHMNNVFKKGKKIKHSLGEPFQSILYYVILIKLKLENDYKFIILSDIWKMIFLLESIFIMPKICIPIKNNVTTTHDFKYFRNVIIIIF